MYVDTNVCFQYTSQHFYTVNVEVVYLGKDNAEIVYIGKDNVSRFILEVMYDNDRKLKKKNFAEC